MRVFTILCVIVSMGLLFASSSINDAGNPQPPYQSRTSWGPDTYGYIALDSNEPGGPPVDWIDISSIGTVVPGLGDDNIVGPFNVGFPFHYYWYDVTSFYVGSNGYLRFSGTGQLSSPFTTMPNPLQPNDVVCFYAADFDPSSGGTVYSWTNNTDTLIVSFVGVPAWNTPSPLGSFDFQVVLSMVDTSITFNYGSFNTADFYNTNGQVGIENNAGDIGIYNYPTNVVPQNYSIKFYYPASTTFQVDDVGVSRVQNDNSGGFFLEVGQDFQANATINNFGNQNEGDFYAIAEVLQYPSNVVVFSDSVYIDTLEIGQSEEVNFPDTWTMNQLSDFYVRVRTNLSGDLVASNDQLDVELHSVVLPAELYLDDNVSEQNWSWAGGNGGMAVKYVPPSYPVKVTDIRASLGGTFTLPVMLQLYDDDGPGGEPGTLLTSVLYQATSAGWASVNIADSNIVINDGGVYATWLMTGDGSPGIDLDNNSLGSRQTWEYTGVWATFRNAETMDAMIRISVEDYVQPVVFFEDFESYTAGSPLTVQNSTDWTTWSGTPGTAEDPMVSDAQAYSGVNSVVIVQDNDLVKPLGTLTSGNWQIDFQVYIPNGQSGYFNTLAEFTPPSTFNWGMELFFDVGGGGRLFGGSGTAVTFNYNYDSWQPATVKVNLDADRAEFWLNNSMIHSWTWTDGASGGGSPLQLDANDFYGGAATDQMYFDDYTFTQLPPSNPAMISVSPTAINDSVMVNDSMDVNIQISNTAITGADPLDWSASLVLTTASNKKLRIPVTPTRATTNWVPKVSGFAKNQTNITPAMLGRAPNASQHEYFTEEPFISLRGVNGPAYGLDAVGGQWLKFWLNAPSSTIIMGTNAMSLYAGDFGPSNVFYAIDNTTGNLVTVDSSSGVATVVGALTVQAGHTWTGMTWDAATGTMYAASTNGAISAIYTVDLNAPSATLVGTTSAAAILIDIACHPMTGQMYGHDLSDQIFLIDKTNGAATVLGSTGFDANYAQGMDFNAETGELYLAAYNNGNSSGELRLVNLTNGSTSLIGPIGVGTNVEVCAFGISSAVAEPWIQLVGPTSGTVDPGDSDNLTARVYGGSMPDTIYFADIEITSNDPANPVMTIPVQIKAVQSTGISGSDPLPTTYAISQNYPNPFNPSTTIKYQLPQSNQVTINIYNLVGQKVRTLVYDNVEPGYHEVTWNGLNDTGVQVGSGVYFYRFQAGDFVRTMKMLMLK